MILYVIIAVVMMYFLFFRDANNEAFTEDITQTKLAKAIVGFLKTDTTYSEFLDFLVKSNNKSYKLLKQETFYELKFLQKSNNLTQKAVMQYLDD
jgi:hypothetical protein